MLEPGLEFALDHGGCHPEAQDEAAGSCAPESGGDVNHPFALTGEARLKATVTRGGGTAWFG